MIRRLAADRAVRTGAVLALAAVVAQAGLARTAVGREALRAEVAHRVDAGEWIEATAAAERLLARSSAPGDLLRRADVDRRAGRFASAVEVAGRVVDAGPTPDPTRAAARHLRSAATLAAHGVDGSLPVDRPGRPTPPGVDRAAALAFAAEDAIAALRGGADPSAAWNLWLARRTSPPASDPTADPGASRSPHASLRRALGSAETRTLQEGLPAILRALEARTPPVETRGPPW